jgi:hypothetical protein
VLGGGVVVTVGAVVVVGGSVVVGGPRRGVGAGGEPDCDASGAEDVTGTVGDGATTGAGAAVVVVVDSSTVVGGRCVVAGCCAAAGTAAGAAVVDGMSSTFAGARCGCSAHVSNATATRAATSARHTSDMVVVATCARPTRWWWAARRGAVAGVVAAVRMLSNRLGAARPPNVGGGASGSTALPQSGQRTRALLIGDPHVPQYCVTARRSSTAERLTG